jgi:hypothetical protein
VRCLTQGLVFHFRREMNDVAFPAATEALPSAYGVAGLQAWLMVVVEGAKNNQVVSCFFVLNRVIIEKVYKGYLFGYLAIDIISHFFSPYLKVLIPYSLYVQIALWQLDRRIGTIAAITN